MTLPAELSAARAVSAETPIHDLTCMKVTLVGTATCIDLQFVYLQSVPPETLAGRDRHEAAEGLWDLVPLATPAKSGALLGEVEAAETRAEGV